MDVMELKLEKNGRIKKQYVIVENGKVYTKTFKKGAKITDDEIYEKDKLMRCSCQYDGKNLNTAILFKYENGKMFCPECGKNVPIVKTIEEMHAEKEQEKKERLQRKIKAQENVHLIFEDTSISSGLSYYGLSTRIEYNDWKKIKHLFQYWDSRNDYDDDEQDTFAGGGLNGWLTTSPEKVEEILNVKPELRLSYRDEKAKIRKEKRQKVINERDMVKKQISEQFYGDDVTQPWADESIKGTQGASMLTWPDGQVIEDPAYAFDIYGGGRKWVINKEENKIWQINNNGHDGDNWGLNNVATGGAGAIGFYVEYTEELESLIKKYVDLHEKLKRT